MEMKNQILLLSTPYIGGKDNIVKIVENNGSYYIFVKDAGRIQLQKIQDMDSVEKAEVERSRLSIQISVKYKEKNMGNKMDYAESSAKIMELIGGVENVDSMTHCLTRLRFVLKEKEKADAGVKELKQVSGVLGVAYAGGQYQVILGDNLFPIYDYIVKNYDVSEGEASDECHIEDLKLRNEKTGMKYYLNKTITFISASVSPFITMVFGAGMLKVVMTLVTFFFPEAANTTTYTLINMIAQAPFYFMPVIIAYGAAKVLKSNPAFAVTIAAALLYPDLVGMAGAEGITMFGIPITVVSYKSTLLPALFMSVFVAYLQKLFYRIVPNVLRSVFAPLCIFLVGWTGTIVVLGPLGYWIGSFLVGVVNFVRNLSGPYAPGIIAGTMAFMVVFGVGQLYTPVMTELFTKLGYDPIFRPAWICHNVAEGGSALGVMLKTKDEDLKAACMSAGIAGIVAGVSEPALYGVNFRFKKTMLSVIIGAAVGGSIAGFCGCKAMAMGYSSALGIVLFTDTMLGMAAAIGVSFIVPFVLSYIFFNDNMLKEKFGG